MILDAKNIIKSYKNGNHSLVVLDQCNLTVTQGEIITIMGESGSGKSTLLNILGTLDKPDSGEISINQKNITSLSENDIATIRNQYIGFVFQFHHLLPEFTAKENILIPTLIHEDVNKSHDADTLLEFVGLTERQSHLPSQLSGGERLRIAVLRAMINKPKVILADEPTGNLDYENSQEVFSYFLKLKEKNKIVLIATHNRELAKKADYTLSLSNGNIKRIND